MKGICKDLELAIDANIRAAKPIIKINFGIVGFIQALITRQFYLLMFFENKICRLQSFSSSSYCAFITIQRIYDYLFLIIIKISN